MRRFLGWTLRGLAGLGLLAVLVAVGSLAYGSHNLSKSWDIPLPSIERQTGPAALSRGGKIFRTACAGCHTGSEGDYSGGPLTNYPEWLGTLYAANLTSDMEFGVGAWTDQELARMIKTAVGRDGRLRATPAFPRIADTDVAAIIGFMRSDAIELRPHHVQRPKSKLSWRGMLLRAFTGDDPVCKTGILAPPGDITVEYGRYMANDVYQCAGCHSSGSRDQTRFDPKNLYGGNGDQPLKDHDGKTYFVPNITVSKSGIAGYTLSEFQRALRDGIGHGDTVLRPPMPLYRYAEDGELEAIYKYLQTVPPLDKPLPASEAPSPRPHATATFDPALMFRQLGCANCHGKQAPYRDQLKRCATKSPVEVANWIRHAPDVRSGTQMPTFAALIDDSRAALLADWVQKLAATY